MTLTSNKSCFKPKITIDLMNMSSNMLLTGRDEIKLADLGLSKLMDRSHASSYAGTPAYMSPEVFKAQFMETSYYPNTDVWYGYFFPRFCET